MKSKISGTQSKRLYESSTKCIATRSASCRKSKISYNVEYERRLGNYLNPDYIDIKVNTYINEEHFSIYFWIDTNNNTIEITSGYYHDEPLPKEIIDIIIDEFNLNVYTIKND